MKNFLHIGSLLFALILCGSSLKAQEHVISLSQNPAYFKSTIKAFESKKVRAGLPFIDDFSYEGPYPDLTLWVDSGAYINNTMSNTQLSRGMATLDGLNKFGRPYYPQQFNSGLADSLTSVPIDLSSNTIADSIYFSFYYQPQGLGFAPENKDSLFLFFKNNTNQWIRIWEMRGTNYQPFNVVMVPIKDVQYLHNSFQFRFVNLASLNLNDDIWNIDYVRLDANRNRFDTIQSDMAFDIPPTSILKNFTSMPYRHFMANQSNEVTASQTVEIRNMYPTPENITPQLNVTELISGTPINSQNLVSTPVPAKSIILQDFLSYPISYVPPSNKSKVVMRNKYFYPQVSVGDRKSNDTIINDIVFDNYFAYDDGSAEKSYFLLGAINFPAKTALKFNLNEPDTMRGLMVHFGPQAPTAAGKYFSIVLYKSLGSGSITDSIILQEDLFRVQYEPSYNGFSSYAFTTPPLLSAGTYYIGITQPANFGSDSIYYGLDVNTNSSTQQLSYNVDGTWYASSITGSVMMRPIVGQEFVPTAVAEPVIQAVNQITLYPNPVEFKLHLNSEKLVLSCEIFSMDGRLVSRKLVDHQTIDVGDLQQGNYILRIKDEDGRISSKIINKL